MRRSFLVPETLLTDRLRLRLPGAEDVEAYTAMLAEPEVNRFVGGAELARAERAFRSLGWMIGHWHLRGYGLWVVTERTTGALVGHVGGYYPPDWPAMEIGWTLGRPWWGKGYALEAARAARSAIHEHLQPARLISLVAVDNERSAALARRLGCTKSAPTVIADTHCIVFEHPPHVG
jgi:RimJ/RimL family protein N-acetyltransferase